MDITDITVGQIIQWVTILASIIGGFKAIKGAIESIHDPIDKLNEKVDILSAATCASMRQSIMQATETYITQGYATLTQKDALHKAYESYASLGGNGFITTLVKRVDELPVEPVKEEHK